MPERKFNYAKQIDLPKPNKQTYVFKLNNFISFHGNDTIRKLRDASYENEV